MVDNTCNEDSIIPFSFADDAIIFLEDDIKQILHLRSILLCFSCLLTESEFGKKVK